MRLSMSVNAEAPVVASVPDAGYLSVHLNMSHRPKDGDFGRSVQIAGIETGETETIHSEWPTRDLKIGDVVELRILSDGVGGVPCKRRATSDHPSNLISNPALAKELLHEVSTFQSRIWQLVSKSEQGEPPDEHKKLATAVGHVIYQIGQHLLHPVFRRHKELIPDELKGELL